MLTKLKIKNFRGFQEHEIPLRELSVVVGKNNAGKSTIVESLRLISIVVSRCRSLSYKTPPKWLELPLKTYGISPSLKNFEIDFKTAFHRYGNPPGLIEVDFEDKSQLRIYLGEDSEIYAVIFNEKGEVIKSRQQANLLHLPSVTILPQITPLQKRENVLSPDYIKSSISSHLASSHFRNQLNLMRELLPIFKESIEKTWSGVSIQSISDGNGKTSDKVLPPGSELFFYVRNEDFVAEVASMGHGLQMWMQIMWFLTRSHDSSTVILDEPDVYMHADLQRRLIRHLRGKFPQIILTTHSVEIMSEIDPSELLVIDRNFAKSRFADSVPIVQNLVEKIGSVQNIYLAKLWYSRKLILIEGEDLKFLKQIQNILYPESNTPFDAIPNVSIGGWGGWNYAVGSHMLVKNALNETTVTYCIFDSDYHSFKEKSERQSDAEKRGVQLHIWTSKEIENYFLVPEVICRLINKKLARRTSETKYEEINQKIQELASEMEDEVFDCFSVEWLAKNRSEGVARANKEARKIIKDVKDKTGSIVDIVSGKKLISKLSNWSQDEFGVQLTLMAIAKEMNRAEVPQELREVVTAIEKGEPFNQFGLL